MKVSQNLILMLTRYIIELYLQVAFEEVQTVQFNLVVGGVMDLHFFQPINLMS